MKFGWAALLLALILLLTGCRAGNAPQADEKEDPALLLGFSQLGWESAWRLANTQSIKSEAEKAGVSLMYDNAEQKQEKTDRKFRESIAAAFRSGGSPMTIHGLVVHMLTSFLCLHSIVCLWKKRVTAFRFPGLAVYFVEIRTADGGSRRAGGKL